MASPKKNKKGKKKNTAPQKAPKTTPKNTKPAAQPTPKRDNKALIPLAIAAVFLGIITFFAYYGALDNDFVDWDDFAYVIDNNLVRSEVDMNNITRLKQATTSIAPAPSPYTTTTKDVFKTVVSLNYHPLTVLTMRWNNNACPDCVQGISAEPFIRGNILLHILNTILTLLIVYWLSKSNLLASILVALVFAIHPMHVESVAWVSERKDVLYTFFFLAGLLSYTQYLDKKGSKWLILAFGLFILSCLSKAMAVVFPLAMLLVYFWHNKQENNIAGVKQLLTPAVIKHTIPFFAVALFFGLLATNVQSGGDFGGTLIKSSSAVAINEFDTFSIVQRFQFASYGFLQYIAKFFLPVDLCTFYPYPDQQSYDNSLFFKVAPLIVLGIVAFTAFSLKFTKSIFFGIGFYLATVILVLQFVSVGAVIMADRYTYLPYIGIAFTLAMLIQEFAPKQLQQVIYGLLILVTMAMLPLTKSQIETWQDSDTLWTNVINLHTANNVIPQTMEQPLSIRGNYYGKASEKEVDKARQAEQAMKTSQDPNQKAVAKAKMEAAQKAQQTYLDKAFDDFKTAARLGSKRVDVYEGIGNTYGMQKNYQEALKNYSIALDLDPTKGSTYFNRGVTYSLLRDHANAISDYTNAMKFAPEQTPMALLNRGISYASSNQREAAIADFKVVLQYNPNQELAKRYLKQLTGQ